MPSTPTSNTALRIQNLNMSFPGRDLLKKVSFRLEEGEWAVLLGANGAGKSSLLRALVGMMPCQAEAMEIFGQDLRHMSARQRARQLAFLPQGLPSYAMSVWDFLTLSRYPHQPALGGLTSGDEDSVREAVHLAGVDHLLLQPVATLSGGERQRVLLAAALAQESPVLLLDEPGASLDPLQRERLWESLNHFRRERHLSLLQISHDVDGSLAHADRILALREGSIALDQPTSECQSQDMATLYLDPPSRPHESSARSSWAPRTKNFLVVLSLLFLAALLAFFILPFVGAISMKPSVLLGSETTDPIWQIFFHLRLPRVLAGALTGALLALAGTLLQALFRNPLATPYTLGISSGAAFGAVFWMSLAAMTPVAFQAVGQTGFALLGAGIAMSLVWRLGKGGNLNDSSLMLAGVAINFSFAGLILLMQAMSDPTRGMQMLRWLMGGLDALSLPVLLLFSVTLVLTGGFFGLKSSMLDLLSAGQDEAAGRGLDPLRSRRGIFLISSVIVAFVSAWCGPVAFVGMMAPHMARQLVGHGHRQMLPVSLLLGALLLMSADALARWIIAPFELPVGVLTALLGGPFFLLILRTRS
jgi:iron complex transport system permease protein